MIGLTSRVMGWMRSTTLSGAPAVSVSHCQALLRRVGCYAQHPNAGLTAILWRPRRVLSYRMEASCLLSTRAPARAGAAAAPFLHHSLGLYPAPHSAPSKYIPGLHYSSKRRFRQP